jgi:L-alanine-DL-glutamate epimerase-like enolase superfamily enzyme
MLEMMRPGSQRPELLSPLSDQMPAPRDGFIDVPEAPGWGVEFTEEMLKQYPPEH